MHSEDFKKIEDASALPFFKGSLAMINGNGLFGSIVEER